jgi:hypothetical protein
MEDISGFKQDETHGELSGGVLSRLHLHHVPVFDSLHISLQLYLFPLPYLPTVIPVLIRIVFFQLTGMLAVLIM